VAIFNMWQQLMEFLLSWGEVEACWCLEAACGGALGAALSQADPGPIADGTAPSPTV